MSLLIFIVLWLLGVALFGYGLVLVGSTWGTPLAVGIGVAVVAALFFTMGWTSAQSHGK